MASSSWSYRPYLAMDTRARSPEARKRLWKDVKERTDVQRCQATAEGPAAIKHLIGEEGIRHQHNPCVLAQVF